ncbi:MAG: antitoxin family protein [Planctomycetaceae bacterium]
MSTFNAVFEKGVLRPLEETDLKEGEQIRVETSPADKATGRLHPPDEAVVETDDFLAGIRFDGPPDLAENFDDYRFGRKTWP